MRKSLILFLMSCHCASGLIAQHALVKITDLGAVADGVFNNDSIIQKAIDSVSKKGGGIALVPNIPGSSNIYLSGTITLKKNVTLQIDSGAVLLGSTNFYDYSKYTRYALIRARNVINIGINGKGLIDGQGDTLAYRIDTLIKKGHLSDPNYSVSNRPSENVRPQLIEITNCDTVRVSNIHLNRSASWVQHYSQCTQLFVDSITVNSTAYWNNDGLDIDNCNGVVVKGDSINSGDDGICLKSDSNAFTCQNVAVSNCTVRSSGSGFKLGTSSEGGFKNISVNNLNVYNTYRTAVALEAVDGGNIDSVTITNVTATHTGGALFIRQGYRNTLAPPGLIKNVYITDMTVDVPLGKPDSGYAYGGPLVTSPQHNPYPSSIVGMPGYPIQNVTLQRIKINFSGGGNRDTAYIPLNAVSSIPEMERSYPEYSMFGELPAWGLYARHVKGLLSGDLKLSYKKDDFRSALLFDDIDTARLYTDTITGYKQDSSTGGAGLPIVYLNDVKKDSIHLLNVPAGVLDSIAVARNNHGLANANFTNGNLLVLKLGDGSTTLDGTTTYASLLEYDTLGNRTGASLELNNKIAGSRLVLGGSSNIEGSMNLSQDARFVVLAGYDTPLGTAQADAAKGTKVIARIPYNGNVDYSTKIPATDSYDSGSLRCVTSYDGSQFWLTGTNGRANSSGTAGGTRYITLGNNATASINTGAFRYINLFNGQLYVPGVKYFAASRPVAASTTINIATDSTSGSSPLAFVFFDHNDSVSYQNGLDLLYVAQTGNTGGIYKYYYDSLVTYSWVKSGFYPIAGGITGLTGRLTAANQPQLFAIMGFSSNNRLVSFTDTAGTDNNLQPAFFTTLDSAGKNYILKSIAFSPDSVAHTLYAGARKITTVVNNAVTPHGTAITVYPNPAANSITIFHPLFNGPATLQLISMNGGTAGSYMVQPGTAYTHLPVSHLAQGMYLIVIVSNGKPYVTQFIR